MSNRLALMLGCSLAVSLFSFSAGAFPVLSPPAEATAPVVTQVRYVCAAGFHHGAYGHCVPNAAIYAGVQDVAPAVCPPGHFHLFPYTECIRAACTYDYYLGADGQCYPYWRLGMGF